MVFTGALVCFLDDALFDYIMGINWHLGEYARVACILMIFSCILFIYVYNSDLLEED